jgi:hypothetical protein
MNDSASKAKNDGLRGSMSAGYDYLAGNKNNETSESYVDFLVMFIRDH